MTTHSTDIQHEMIALLGRIVGDQPLPPDLQRRAIEMLAIVVQQPGTSTDGGSTGRASSLLTSFQPTFGGAGAPPVGNRRLVYVHGICRHESGYSDPWWDALNPFEPSSFGGGVLGQTRLEVLWSDIVNLASASMQVAALAASAPAAVGSAYAVAAVSVEAARRRAADEIKEVLRDRADQHVLATSVRNDGLATAQVTATDLGGLISIPGLNCVDDFSVYLIDDIFRQQIIDRFINIVRPQLQAGCELDIIAHSWGTVVAYEGLRQLDADPLLTPQVRNLFTVGAALSIGPVKMRLREANKDGKKPKTVRRWVNLDAHGDIVGGPLKGRPYAVDFDFLNLEPVGCNSLLGLVSPVCAHGSYFDGGNTAVNKDIFARYIDQA